MKPILAQQSLKQQLKENIQTVPEQTDKNWENRWDRMAKESTIDFIILAIAILISDKILWICLGIKIARLSYQIIKKIR